jgi:hydroxyacylglutathione hydrolase
VLFKQFLDDDLGCASYFIGDEQAGEAVVVDPGFAIEQYLDEAHRQDVRLIGVLETHTHADHVSGHGRLALEHGLRVAVHPLGEPEHPFDALEDGDQIEVGDVMLEVLHTPGHRPEHCCFAVTDRARGGEPWLVLTGDSLFVGDAGRPDLAVDAREGAHGLFHSLRRLLALPDGVEIYPGHVAGSMCGTGMSSKASSTIGFERRFNRLLGVETVEAFVCESAGAAALRPPNVQHIVSLNRGPFVGAQDALAPRESADGCVVLDVRPADVFAAGHVQGAISVPIDSSSFSTKAGFVLLPQEPIVLHASSVRDAELAARRLNAVGFLQLAGYLEEPATPARIEPIALDELERLIENDAVQLVDVREANERDDGYIPGSRHMPYRLVRSLGGQLAGDRPVVTICESGSRAGIAASILAAAGIDARPVLTGGIPGWEARGNATIEFRRCGA